MNWWLFFIALLYVAAAGQAAFAGHYTNAGVYLTFTVSNILFVIQELKL